MVSKLAMVIVATALVIGGSVTVLGSIAPFTEASRNHLPSFNGAGGPIPLVLHSPASADAQLNHELILPNPSTLGPSFKIVGVRINGLPAQAGAAWRPWSATFFLWNQTFVNGTTTNIDVLGSAGVAIVETAAPPSSKWNSTLAAQDLLTPGPICAINAGNSTTCSTDSYSGGSYITKQNSLAIVVAPNNDLTWLDDRNGVWMNVIGGSLTLQEAMNLANSMTQ